MSNEIATQQGGVLSMDRPDYLAEIDEKEWGTDGLAQYSSPPFIKIVQKQSSAPYNEHEVGSVLVVPQNIYLFAPNQEFYIIPIFQYTEYVMTNPYTLKTTLPMIRDRSLDPKGELAMKCRDFNNREVICPEAPAAKQQDSKYKCCYYEHISFICKIEGHEIFEELPVVFTFRSGEFKTGKLFAQAIDMRRMPIYCTRFRAWTAERKDDNRNFGFCFDGPTMESGKLPYVTKEEMEVNRELYRKFQKLHDENAIKVDYEGERSSETPDETPEM